SACTKKRFPSSRCASAIQNRTALLHRKQKTTNGPVGRGRPLSPRHFVGGAEVDSLVNTDADDITSRIGKAMICLRCVGSRARHQEGRFIPEEILESTRHGARYIVGARGIVRIWRRWEGQQADWRSGPLATY